MNGGNDTAISSLKLQRRRRQQQQLVWKVCLCIRDRASIAIVDGSPFAVWPLLLLDAAAERREVVTSYTVVSTYASPVSRLVSETLRMALSSIIQHRTADTLNPLRRLSVSGR
jgi:hypothetical protein